MKKTLSSETESLLYRSALYQKLKIKLASSDVKVLSLDIFDTLLRRNCDDPAWVFEESARRVSAERQISVEPYDYRQCRIEAEKKARHKSVTEEVTLSEIFDCLALGYEDKKRLMELELEVEKEILYLDPIIVELVFLAKTLGKRVILISDMYLPGAFLSELVGSLIGKGIIEYTFCSSDIRLTKATGSMFSHVLGELSLSANQIFHIGDNEYADIKNAKVNNIDSFHYEEPSYVREFFEREKRYQVELPPSVNHARKLALMSIPQGMDEKSEFFYQYGASILGPVLVAFAQWTLTRVRSLDIPCILSLMREGGIISDCINRALALIDSDHNIRCIPCYVSRKATFLPALHGQKISEGLSQALTRKNYTVGDVLSEFELDEPELAAYRNLRLDRLDNLYIDGITALSFIKSVMDKNEAAITQLSIESVKMLREYIENLTNNSAFATLDFGGGATIQHQLQRGLKQPAALNLLLYCTARGYGKSPELALNSFIPYNYKTRKGINLITRSPELLEIALVGKQQTTIGYERDSKGHVHPRLASGEYSPEHKAMIDAFELGVANYQAWSSMLEIESPDLDDRISYLKILERLIECPTTVEVANLGNLIHEDNFGSNRSYPLIEENAKARICEEGLSDTFRKFSKNSSYAQTWLPWPQGSITSLDPDFIKDIQGLAAAGDKHMDAVECLVELAHSHGINEVIIYGAGEFFDCLYPALMKKNISVKGLIDKKAQFGSYFIADIEVVALADASITAGDTILIASAAYIDEIRQDIYSTVLYNNIKILSL